MSGPEWRIAHASVVGSSHARTETPCQDVSGHEAVAGALLLFAADGAGSAARSAEGARLVGDRFVEHFGRLLLDGKSVLDIGRTDCLAWVVETRQAMGIYAESEGAPLKDFACTFIGALVEDAGVVCLQIGDGAVVFSTVEEPEVYAPLTWPDQGEYANLTHFLTSEDSETTLTYRQEALRVHEIALFTDGIQHLTLHMASKTAHAPFFRALFAPLRGEPAGFSEAYSGHIAAFFNLEMVLEKTDDDKTLVLASRVASEPMESFDAAL